MLRKFLLPFLTIFHLTAFAAPVSVNMSGTIQQISPNNSVLSSMGIGLNSNFNASLFYDTNPELATWNDIPFGAQFAFQGPGYGGQVNAGAYFSNHNVFRGNATFSTNLIEMEEVFPRLFLQQLNLPSNTYDTVFLTSDDPSFNYATNTGISYGILYVEPSPPFLAAHDGSFIPSPSELAAFPHQIFGIGYFLNGALIEVATSAPAPVPEPASWLLILFALLAFSLYIRKKRKTNAVA